MSSKPSEPTYFTLEITADSHTTEIWLGDDGGSLVVREVGVLREGLLPGNYVVEFGLGTGCYPVPLRSDSSFTQRELELAGPCERPVFELPPDAAGEGRTVAHPVLRAILEKRDSNG